MTNLPMPTRGETPETFEQSLHRLEEIVGELEKGDLSLEFSLGRYEEGIRRLKHCYALLEQAELKVVQLVRDNNGNLQEVPFHRQPPPTKTGGL